MASHLLLLLLLLLMDTHRIMFPRFAFPLLVVVVFLGKGLEGLAQLSKLSTIVTRFWIHVMFVRLNTFLLGSLHVTVTLILYVDAELMID